MNKDLWNNSFDYRVGYAFGGTAFCSFLIGLFIGKYLGMLEGLVYVLVTIVVIVLFGCFQYKFMVWLYEKRVKRGGAR